MRKSPKVIITSATTGAMHMPIMSPHLPITPDEIVADSVAAVEALVSGDPPAVEAVIADYHLDDGTGISAIGKLRAALDREVPALLVTADRTPDVRAEAERDNILVQNKPVRPASMRAWLTQFSALQREAAE